jgi:hypothetical protein
MLSLLFMFTTGSSKPAKDPKSRQVVKEKPAKIPQKKGKRCMILVEYHGCAVDHLLLE